jgi:hypothetical protein
MADQLIEAWEVVCPARGVRSDMSPGTFRSEQEALSAITAREVYPELWVARRVRLLPAAIYGYR